VQKFDADGRVVPGFWEAVLTQPSVPVEPAYVTATSYGDAERLLVLDSAGPSLLVYTVDGVLDEVATGWWADLPLHPDGGLVFAGGVLYIGDPGQGRVLTFDTKGGFLGMAAGFAGAARYLALDRRGRLLVHPGSGGPVTRLDPAAAYATSGSFVAGPISVDTSAHRWDRVVAVADPLPAGAHVRFSTYVGASAPADDPVDGPAASGWQAAPPDALDLLVSGVPGRSLWLRGELRGDGATTPALHQLRVTYDHDGYLRYLPAIFREAEPGTFLERALALMESFVGDTETTIDDLPLLFDPAVTPDTGSPSWLDWLASWIDLLLAETWDADRRRSATAAAFAGYGRRGTPTALRDHVELYAGVAVALDEPGAHVSVWSLGRVSVLGWDTVLAVAEPQGAVLDRTAVVDRSHLSTDADYGAPLFESTAHRFCVRLRARDAGLPGVTGRVRDALDREKPAHTEYELCVVDDRMRVGIQSRVGLDAFVARPRDPWVAGSATRLGTDTLLPGAGDRPTAVGRDARVGDAVRA
jgi:phage tail-like protein